MESRIVPSRGFFKCFLEGESESFAQDITFKGDFTIKVSLGWKFTASQKEGKVFFDDKKALQIEKTHFL